MNNLAAANVEKCLSVLEEFHEAIGVDLIDPELLPKKQDAEKALEQLDMLLKEEQGIYSAEEYGELVDKDCSDACVQSDGTPLNSNPT